MKNLTLLLLLFLCTATSVIAQKKITGKIVDAQGNPLAGVSILAKGTSVGTRSKTDGTYSISVPVGTKILEFVSVGMNPLLQTIGKASIINVHLQSAVTQMDDVVVVAYGAIKKENFLGSAAQVTANQIKNRPLTNPLNALVGAAPGIQTTSASGAPGDNPNIILRGFGSYSLGNSPLYIVDGSVYEAGFSNLSIDDIETITALKDASATSLYGSRASNGVVMITTKKGKKGKSSLTFRILSGSSDRAIPPYPTVNVGEYYPLAWESYRNGLVYGSTAISIEDAGKYASGIMPRFTTGSLAGQQIFRGTQGLTDIFQELGGYNPFTVGNTAIVHPNGTLNPNAALRYGNDLNWLDQAARKGARNEYAISYTSSGNKSNIASSFGYLKDKGWGLNSQLERFSGRVSANVQPTKWIKIGMNLAANRTLKNNATTSNIANPFYFARYIAPIYPVYAHDPVSGEVLVSTTGVPQFDFGNEFGYKRPYNSGRHTIAEHLWNKDNTIRDVLSARAYTEFTFRPWLKFTTSISGDIKNEDDEVYDNPIVGDGYPSGRYIRGTSKSQTFTFNQILNFNKRFGSHNINALAGHENYSDRTIGTGGTRIGQNFDNVYVYSNFGTINALSSSVTEDRLEAYLSRVNYEYGGKYLFSASLRRDGSSKFPKKVRWHNFWSVAGGWKIEKERFFNVPWIDALKLRASYGQVGNSGVSDYAYQDGYSIGYDDDTRPGTFLSNLGSPTLTWESASIIDLGVDFSMLKGRVHGIVGYFSRATSGLIYKVPKPLQNGGTLSGNFTISENVGNMSNKGIELQLIGNIIRQKKINWDITLNATHYKNKITKMPVQIRALTNHPFKREVGHSIYDFYTRTFYGIDPHDGEVLYLGVSQYNTANSRLIDNGKGGADTVTIDHTNARQSYIGKSAIPDVFGSILNNISYKNFELSFTLTYQLGGYVYDEVYRKLASSSINGTTYHTDLLKRWQKPGDKTSVPRLDNLRNTQHGAGSTRWLTSGNYLSINNISLTYHLPKIILSKIAASDIRVFVSGENLHFFTKRKGININGSFSGKTADRYDVARTITMGITLNF